MIQTKNTPTTGSLSSVTSKVSKRSRSVVILNWSQICQNLYLFRGEGDPEIPTVIKFPHMGRVGVPNAPSILKKLYRRSSRSGDITNSHTNITSPPGEAKKKRKHQTLILPYAFYISTGHPRYPVTPRRPSSSAVQRSKTSQTPLVRREF